MFKLMIPPPLYALLFASGMWALDHFLPIWDIIFPPWHQVGFALIGIALLIDLGSLGLFLHSRTTPNLMKPEKASQLVTSGLYRFSRNPMYLSLLIILSGWAIYLGSLSVFFLLPIFISVLTTQQILPEERVLADKFGQRYLDYKARVRRWI